MHPYWKRDKTGLTSEANVTREVYQEWKLMLFLDCVSSRLGLPHSPRTGKIYNYHLFLLFLMKNSGTSYLESEVLDQDLTPL